MSEIEVLQVKLTRDGLKEAKKRLWKVNRHIKSMHLTEAIARALGFRTHAAALAACDQNAAREPQRVSLRVADVEQVLHDMDIRRAERRGEVA